MTASTTSAAGSCSRAGRRSARLSPTPDSLADLAAVRLAIANQAIVECESTLYIPARAHRAATGDEIPDDAYRMELLDLLGGWDFNFDDQREISAGYPN
jgi:hypothetical protein